MSVRNSRGRPINTPAETRDLPIQRNEVTAGEYGRRQMTQEVSHGLESS
jgi:hypothetical protein